MLVKMANGRIKLMKKILKEIKEEFLRTDIKDISRLIDIYKDDDRAGVIKLIESYKNKIKTYEKEMLRLEQMKKYENFAYQKGYKYIVGLDEVGRGPLAGPVVTAGVILPKDFSIPYINDSKKLSDKKRKELFYKIKENALAIAINMEDNNIIDDINILEATKLSMKKTIEKLSIKPDFVIIDALDLKLNIPYLYMNKADENSISVASASIIAKVTRDEYMKEMAKIYPEYKFEENKGYGTKEHIEALKKYGACEIHRNSFIKNFI